MDWRHIMHIVKNIKKYIFCLVVMLAVIFLISGCARWPEEPNGGGTGQKQLTIKVEINENGTINTDDGYYYIVFDTREDASFPPYDDIENWEEGYYYIRLDDFGFYLGEVGNDSEEYIWDVPTAETNFQVTVDLAKLGNPEEIFMNVITTDKDEETYDYMNDALSLTIGDTSFVPYNNIVSDFSQDSTGGADFDIIQVTTTIIVP
jgi:hypothetical protein